MNYCIIHRRFILLHELHELMNREIDKKKYIRMTENLHVIPLQRFTTIEQGSASYELQHYYYTTI